MQPSKKNVGQDDSPLAESRNKKRRTGEAVAINKKVDPKRTKNTKWPQAIR